MKLSLLALATCMLSCACVSSFRSRATTTTPVYYPADYEPPTDLQISLHERTQFDRQVSDMEESQREEQTYRDSVKKIEAHFADESLQMQMCAEVYGSRSQECYNLLRKFCTVDTYLDSRSGHHVKGYCSQESIDSHNPHHP